MKKRAILIGMNHYIKSSSIIVDDLPGTETDVIMMEKRLHQLKFETSSYMDLGESNMRKRIQQFAAEAPCDSINIIYFSGHGGHMKGENYLYPIDFGPNLNKCLPFDKCAYNLNSIYPCFEKKVKLIIIVDACRTDLRPEYSGNYSEMVAHENTYIAYATQFGDTSGCTLHSSYFTEALCENILTPNISIDQLFTNVRALLYSKHGEQIANSVNGLMEYVTLNEQAETDDIDKTVLNFVDQYGDMYDDKYGVFSGDDLVFIDAAQYCDISLLDAIYKFTKLDAERCKVERNLSESHEKLISFWSMLDTGLKQDKFYTWQYRGRPIRLGEIPPLPVDMQMPLPEHKKELVVDFKLTFTTDAIIVTTNLPDNFQFYGMINNTISISNIVVKDNIAKILLSDTAIEVETIDLHSVLTTVTSVDQSIVGDRCRNLVGQYIGFHPIYGNYVEFHYRKNKD